MADITSKKDIELLVNKFYDRITTEEHLKELFEPSMAHLKEHLERVVNFWDNMLFFTGSYTGGMMWAHLSRHKDVPFTINHFERWLALWFLSVDELYEGKNATFVKDKAYEIAQIIAAKLQPQ